MFLQGFLALSSARKTHGLAVFGVAYPGEWGELKKAICNRVANLHLYNARAKDVGHGQSQIG